MSESKSNAYPKVSPILMVCFIFPPEFGGAIVQALRLGAELQSRGCDVAFLADNGAGADADMRHELFDLYRRRTFSDNRASNLRKLIWAARIVLFALMNPRFRIFHFHSVQGPELLCMPMLKWLGRKTIVKLTLAESDDPATLTQRRLMGPIYRACLRAVHRFVAISPSLRSMACSVGVPAERVPLIANGVETERYHLPTAEAVQQARRKLDIAAGVPVLVSIGAIEYRKGYDLLLAAFGHIRRQLPNAVLLVVGPGNDLRNDFHVGLLKFLSDNAVEGVRFLGRRNDIHEILKAADMFVFCSRQEGFGTAIVEAMCTGLSVAVMDIPGITEWIIGDRPAATNCPSRDPKIFANACLQLLETRSDAAAGAIEARAQTSFGIETIANSYVSVYQEILDDR